jgi:hypothetical protein
MAGWLRRYRSHPDPRLTAANTVALVLGWNQPFYPLYLWWIVGPSAWVGLPTIAAGVVFALVPAVVRRNARAGRVLLVATAIGNTVLCMKLLGEASGVGLFLFPCAMLATLLFRPAERVLMLGLTAAPLLVWLLLRPLLGAPPVVFPAAAQATLFTLNAASAGAVMVFLAWMLVPAGSAAEGTQETVHRAGDGGIDLGIGGRR